MPFVGGCQTLRCPWFHGQKWLRAVKRLNLRLFINTKDQRVLGWIHIKPNNGGLFLREFGVRALAAPMPDFMGLQVASVQDAVDRPDTEPRCLGELPDAPGVRAIYRSRAGKGHYLQSLLLRYALTTPASGSVHKTAKTNRLKSFAPFEAAVVAKAGFLGDSLQRQSFGCAEQKMNLTLL